MSFLINPIISNELNLLPLYSDLVSIKQTNSLVDCQKRKKDVELYD